MLAERFSQTLFGNMKIVWIFATLFVLSLSLGAQASTTIKNELRPFQSDQCSFWPDRLFGNEYARCCIEHDYYYWMGGTQEQRLKADLEFRSCLSKSTIKINANMMYLAVRFMGRVAHVNSYRWGYGWKYVREDLPLNEEEMIEVLRKDPANIYEAAYPTWTKEARKKYQEKYTAVPFPTVSGNYCLDEVIERLDLSKLNSEHLALKFKEHDALTNTYVIYTNLCDGEIIATFNVPSLNTCSAPRYSTAPSSYLKLLKKRGSCR